jgi:hypothetical protein
VEADDEGSESVVGEGSGWGLGMGVGERVVAEGIVEGSV